MLGMVFQGVPRAEREERARQVAARRSGSRTSRDHYPGAALRRHAPARGARARAQSRDRHPADGRAVRRARRADPHDPRRGPLGAAVAHRQDHRVRDPQAGRSRVPRRPRRGVLGAARHHQGDHHGRRAASAQARLRHLGEIHRHAQRALRAAARRDPQDHGAKPACGAAAGARRHERPQARRATAARQPRGAGRRSWSRSSCCGTSPRPAGA